MYYNTHILLLIFHTPIGYIMEREQDIARARKVLNGFLYRPKRGKSRIHEEALEMANERLRALNGICGICENLILNIFYQDGKDVVATKCKANNSPVELYMNTPLGQVPVCPDFTSSEENHTEE
jgi:hypothetical protein